MAPHNSHWLSNKKALLPRLLDQLNAALSEEWLSYYHYWTCARLVSDDSDMRVRDVLMHAAEDELKHASQLAERIIALGGIPPTTPQEWYRYARCTYDTPLRFDSKYLIRITVIGEECACRRYQAIEEMTRDRDFATHDIVSTILNDEHRHLDTLRALLTDSLKSAHAV